MKLLVSGIVYTPYGDNGWDMPVRYNEMKVKYPNNPGPIKAYFDSIKIGQFLSIKVEFYNNVPVFYGFGVIESKKIISRVLRSSLLKETKARSYSHADYSHSWCADSLFNEVGYQEKKTITPDCTCCPPREEVYHNTTHYEYKQILGASIVRNPCCLYTSIYLPNVHGFHNKNLFKLHKKKKEEDYYEQRYLNMNLYNKIRLDGYKFKSLFGKKVKEISGSGFLNLKKDPDMFFNIANSIHYSC